MHYAKCSYFTNKVSYDGGSSSNLTCHMKIKHITVTLEQSVRKQDQNLVTKQNIDDPSSLRTTISEQPSALSKSTYSEPAQTSINLNKEIVKMYYRFV